MTTTLFDVYFEHLMRGLHHWPADDFKVALSNTAPNTATNQVLADITEIAAGNGYTAGGISIANLALARTGTEVAADGDNVTFLAGPADLAPFRYAILYNNTPTVPLKPLISVIDNGEPVVVPAGQPFSVIFNDLGVATLGKPAPAV